MPKKQKTPKELSGHIEYPKTPGILTDEPEVIAWAKKCAEIKHNKLSMLADSYGIDMGPERWYLLASKLADEFPGFQPKKSRKRPARWNDHIIGVLVVELERIKNAGEANSIREAGRLLANKQPWKDFLAEAAWDEDKTVLTDIGEALRVKHSNNHKRPLATLYRTAFAGYSSETNLAEWEEIVTSVFKDE